MARKPSAVSKARGRRSRAATTGAVAAVLVVAVAVFGGVYLLGGPPRSSAPITPRTVAASFPTTVEDGVIVAGSPLAPRTLDVYEDALCPVCGRFEATDGQRVTAALGSGRLRVRYHVVNLLDDRSRPAGYSTAAGNAMICAAENGAFPDVHATLFAAQPEEGAAGYSNEQLADLGPALHADPGYASCVQKGRHNPSVTSNDDAAVNDPALAQTGGDGSRGFGTPTIVSGGHTVEPGSPELDALLAG